MNLVVLATGVLALALLLVGWMCRAAAAHGFIALPNARSSHTRPTPTAGGVGIFIACLAGFAVLYVSGQLPLRLLGALAGGGAALAAVGFIDDRHPLDARVRLAVHIVAATWAVACLGGAPPVQIGARVIEPGLIGSMVATLLIVWWVNLFNFMDGIDGIAASQAAFMGLAGAVLAMSSGASPAIAAMGVVIAAAALGFLRWNWPPSRIFMGDVGSGFLGFVLAVVALAHAHERAMALWIWLALGAVFLADATATLIRRMLRRERIYAAHRTHAYQWLSRRWGSHRRVTVAVLAVNFLCVLPVAWAVHRWSANGVAIAATALGVLFAAALAAGAGRPEQP